MKNINKDLEKIIIEQNINLTEQEIKVLKGLDISNICYLLSLEPKKIKKYLHFIIRLIEEKLPITIIKNNYFSNLSNNELEELLTYKTNKFKNYIHLILSFEERNLLNDNLKKIKTVMTMLFNRFNLNTIDTMHMLENTNLIASPSAIDFTFKFLNLAEGFKIKAIKQIILKTPKVEKININKIFYDILKTKNEYQAKSLVSILTIKGIFNCNKLSEIINLILNNPKSVYTGYLEDIFKTNPQILNDNRILTLCEYILNCKDDEQAELISTILEDVHMLKSNSLIKTLDIVKNPKNKIYYDHIYSLLERKEYLGILKSKEDFEKGHSFDENVFNKILDSLLKTKVNYQINSIIGLIHLVEVKDKFIHSGKEYEETTITPYFKNILKDPFYLDLTIETILKTKHKFQALAVVKVITKKGVLEKDNLKLVLDNILKTKKEYQANAIVNVIEKIINNRYFNQIIETILNSDEIIANTLSDLLEVPELLKNEDFLTILHEFSGLKTTYQADTFILMLNKEDFKKKIFNEKNTLNYNYLFIFDYLRKASKQQSQAILEIILNTKIYHNLDYTKLIQYLFILKDEKIVELLKNIILLIDKISYEKVVSLINLAINYPESEKVLTNLVVNKFNILQNISISALEEKLKEARQTKEENKKVLRK